MSRAKVSKSRALIASEMARIRSGTTCFIRCSSRVDVSTVRCMPAVLDVPFLSSDTTQMRAWISGQCSRGATSTARESEPSAAVPFSQATKPPNRERQAEPEPCRAMRESSEGEVGSLYRAAREATRAANPAAEDASPAAVGKLLKEDMWTLNSDNYP